MVREGNRVDPPPPDQTAEQAAFWDARLRSPDCTDADRARFSKWRSESAAHSAEFERLQQIATLARQEVSRADLRALRDAARRAASRRPWRGPAGIAAALALTGLCAVLLLHEGQWASGGSLRGLITSASPPATSEPTEQYATQVGQRSTVTLKDGSSVELNAKSIVRVRFTATQRRVELLSGQALFRVAKNSQRPFVVGAGDRDIIAIGTEFDVRRDSSSVRVTLVEGRVAVTQPLLVPNSGPSRQGGPEKPSSTAVYLEPGQQSVTQEISGVTRVVSVDVQKVIGWRDGRVSFEDVTLADALIEMNRHSLRQIRLADSALAQQRISGTFRAGEQDAFVEALESYFPLTVRVNDDAEIVLVGRSLN